MAILNSRYELIGVGDNTSVADYVNFALKLVNEFEYDLKWIISFIFWDADSETIDTAVGGYETGYYDYGVIPSGGTTSLVDANSPIELGLWDMAGDRTANKIMLAINFYYGGDYGTSTSMHYNMITKSLESGSATEGYSLAEIRDSMGDIYGQ